MNRVWILLKNEAGSVIVYTLMVLTVLTLVGLAAIRNADTEIEIAGTELKYQRNFYLAEGAAMEAVNWLENNSMTSTSGPSWMEMTEGALNAGTANDYWEGTMPVECTLDNNASFMAAYEGVVGGSSLDVNKTKLHDITIYGRSQKLGVAEVRIGYRKAF
jgi:Tfp pilus assembly protein PilX